MINILTCIYLQGGHAIQILKQGQSLFCDGDACSAARILCLVGDVIVIDMDALTTPNTYASSHQTPNTHIIKEMLTFAKVRVYGGLHTAAHALDWLDQGVTKAVVAAERAAEMRQDIPPERLVAAISVTGDECHVIGQDGALTSRTVFDVISSLSNVDEFLVTFVDAQGSMRGIQSQLTALEKLAQTKKSIIVTGGIASTPDILSIDKLGLIPLVGTALHTNQLDLGDVIVAYTKSDRPDGLFATVVADEQGVALGLVYSNTESIRAAVHQRKGIYHSRSRGLWEKGATSGAHQDLLAIHLDCDRDALRFTVHQHGAGFCHLERRTCWSRDQGIGGLMRTLESRKKQPVPNSYTNRLFADPALLHNKLVEEAHELIEAKETDEIAWEAADVIYFAAVLCANHGVNLTQIENMLDRRTLRIRRRAGDAKPDKTTKEATKDVTANDAKARTNAAAAATASASSNSSSSS